MIQHQEEKAIDTPWGPSDHAQDLGGGVLSITTSSHGGLLIPKAMLQHIPKAVRETFYDANRKTRDGGIWAEEDIEMVIAIAFLFDHLDRYALTFEFNERIANKEYWTERATRIANNYERYAPALEHLKNA